MIAGQKLTSPAKECRYFLRERRLPVRRENALFVVLLSALFVVLFGFAFYATVRVHQLQDEVDLLKKRLDPPVDDYTRGYPDFYSNEVEDDVEDPENLYDYEEDDRFGTYDEDTDELLEGGNFTKEGPEKTRAKRDVQTTPEGIPILNRPYDDSQRRRSEEPFRTYDVKPAGGDGIRTPVPLRREGYRSVAWSERRSPESPSPLNLYDHYGKATSPSPSVPMAARRSRVMHQEDKSKAFRRKVKKSQLKALDSDATIIDEDGRIHKQRRTNHNGHRRNRTRGGPLAFHFDGDTSRYEFGRHPRYNGNGHLKHPEKKFVDWIPKNWEHFGQSYDVSDGALIIKDPGLYFVYAQIYYIDQHDRSGFVVKKNDEKILQCVTMTISPHPINKTNTCFTAGVELFKEHDAVYLEDLYHHYTLFMPGRSFFGAFKI